MTDHKRSAIPPADYVLTDKDRKRHASSQAGRQLLQQHIKAIVDAAPPLTEQQRTTLRALLLSAPNPRSIMRWKMRLSCGHLVEDTCHASYDDPTRAFTTGVHCDECGGEPCDILAYEPVGTLDETPPAPPPAPEPVDAEVAQLDEQIARTMADLAAIRKRRNELRRRARG